MSRLLVTGGTGYVGSAVVSTALKAGYRVQVLTRSESSAERLRRRGAEPVLGDLTTNGPWQRAAEAAEHIIHLATPPIGGRRWSRRAAERFRDDHLRMSWHLLANLDPGQARKVVFVASAGFFGDTGRSQKITEEHPSAGSGLGQYVAPSVSTVPEYLAQGVPVVMAFPGRVYGPDSWFSQRFLEPLAQGKAVAGLRGHDPMVSPIHVADCARALVHLLDHGVPGQGYFLADDEPLSRSEMVARAARALGVPARIRALPAWLANLAMGSVATEACTADQYLSNTRLRNTGFPFEYPTFADGLPAVVARWLERNRAAARERLARTEGRNPRSVGT